MEQLSPSSGPQNNDEGAKEKKRPVLVSWNWGVGREGGGEWWSRCSIYFAEDCSNIDSNFLGVSDQGGKVHEVNPM